MVAASGAGVLRIQNGFTTISYEKPHRSIDVSLLLYSNYIFFFMSM